MNLASSTQRYRVGGSSARDLSCSSGDIVQLGKDEGGRSFMNSALDIGIHLEVLALKRQWGAVTFSSQTTLAFRLV